jgi:trimeric autotransporter adhesin
VFANNYQLWTLGEVENYINTNQHLPGLPSAQEVAREGVDVGQLNARLLEKIEELTLYVIELKKENQAKDQQLKQQASAIDKILKRLALH